MTTGAMPPNLTFQMSAQIKPMLHVQTKLYNEAGFIPHPLEYFGYVQGVPQIRKGDVAGTSGNVAGGIAWSAASPHTLNGREPGNNY